MAVTVRNDRNEVLYQADELIDDAYLRAPELCESEYKLDKHFASMSFKETHFDGFILGHGSAATHQRLRVESRDITRRIGLHFMLEGEVSSRVRGIDHTLVTSANQHNIVYSPQSEEEMDISHQPSLQVFVVAFCRDRFVSLAANNGPILDTYAEKVAGDRPVYLRNSHNITQRMLQVIDDVRHCHFTGGLKKLFLQSKAMELLALQSEQTEWENKRALPSAKLPRGDEDRIYHARDLLLAHAQDPLSLSELARKAGINEFKLKNGFKKVFNNTVFGYLNDFRMDQAQEMVRAGEKSFTDIAGDLGYSSLQHFSAAYRKKFGCSPRESRR
ncbi:helix-turn-helix transcriptional regulator [Chitinophaga lutea]